MTDSIKILQFKIQNACLGCDITELDQICPMMTLETVPNSPPYLQGMMNLNGILIPVLDLASYLQMKSFSYDLDTSILLVKKENKLVGFTVQQVNDLFSIEKNTIQQDDLFKDKKSPYLGSVVINNMPCLILKFHSIIKEVSFQKR